MLTNDELEKDTLPEPTKEQSASIKAIAKDTVHKICSGQVVLSLAVAVKELVENAIDAGATLVEVKLREYGLETVEVSDNGSGVEESNLEGMTAKYHTSKIREFVDLQGVETFGFRGEALSSLCALTDLTIVTRHKSADVGIKIELDHQGGIKKRSLHARNIGTTVYLANLFTTLPVRRRDFLRNIKKEFNKMCQILQAYCLATKGVRIICKNQTLKGSKSVVMQTNGAVDVLSNIAAIFGNKQRADILPLKQAFGEEKLTAESLKRDLDQSDLSLDDDIQLSADDMEHLNARQFQLEGYISSCKHGCGRSTKDRQFFYVNSRPCDPKNIAKVINEVYHRYNVQQYPFVFLNVLTARSEVDVNLTPDKRQLLVNNEKILLLTLKKALLNTFGQVPSTYKMQNTTIQSMLKLNTKETDETTNSINDDESVDSVPLSSSQRFMDVLSQWKRTGNTAGTAPHTKQNSKRKYPDEIEIRTLKMKKMNEYLTKEAVIHGESSNEFRGMCYESENESNDEETGEKNNQSSVLDASIMNIKNMNKESAEYDALLGKHHSPKTDYNCQNKIRTPIKIHSLLPDEEDKTVATIVCKVQTPSKAVEPAPKLRFELISSPQKSLNPSTQNEDEENIDSYIDATLSSSQSSSNQMILLDESSSENEVCNFTCAELRTSLAEIELNVCAEENLMEEKNSKKNKLDRLRFKSEISPSQNQNAEAELQREISKSSFASMDIIGQFNLGFIIVKLDTDLFIVDQHATDEKYNFETLQRTTTLQYQSLAVPQPLEMTAVNEMVLLDNLEVFEKNGFKFEINENAPPTKKVRLLGKPCSKNWEFGKEDIDELIFMLQDAPEGTMCRPSRIRSMFASRACRKSVMIGQALKKTTMKTLIKHMGEIEQPWNCPHGRPTMRHLINIAMLLDDEEAEKSGDN